MSELLVCLTFDHDNASSMISRKLTSPTMISRGDFGIVAVPRILDLLRQHEIPTTWFIPGHTIESGSYRVPGCWLASSDECSDEGAKQGFAASASVVHELKEAEIKRQLVL